MPIVLSLVGDPEISGAEGYMDDSSDSYKRFFVDKKTGKLTIIAEYPKANFKNELVFRDVIRKFDPDAFFMKAGVEVKKMDIRTLHDVYWNNYRD